MITKGYGLTVHDIDMSCPADLEPYAKAYKLEQDNMDALMWIWWGNYGFSATLTAVERCLAGKKSKTEYIGKPISQRAQEDKELATASTTAIQEIMSLVADVIANRPMPTG